MGPSCWLLRPLLVTSRSWVAAAPLWACWGQASVPCPLPGWGPLALWGYVAEPHLPNVSYIWWQRPSLLSGWSALPHAGSTCAPALRGSVPGICMGITGHSRSSLLGQAPGSRCGSSRPVLARALPRAFVRHALPARASCPVASGQLVRGRAGAAAVSQWLQPGFSRVQLTLLASAARKTEPKGAPGLPEL